MAVRLYRTPGRGWHRQSRTLFRLPLDGGAPEQLVNERLTQPDSPHFSPDGKSLYYHVSFSIGERSETVRVQGPAEPSPEFRAALKAGGYAADVGEEPSATTPKVSPDGKWLTFSREMPDQTFEWRGHSMRPSTGLWIRDLAAETLIAWGSAWGDFPEIDSIGVARSEVNRRKAGVRSPSRTTGSRAVANTSCWPRPRARPGSA